MILRIFRAQVYADKRQAFASYLRDEGLPTTRAQPGLVDCWLGEPLSDEDNVYVFVSVWRDLGSLQAFRGSDLTDPGVLPSEVGVIKEARVEHFVIDDAVAGLR